MPNVKLTKGYLAIMLVVTKPHWPRISSIRQNFLRLYPLSCVSPQDLWKRFQFVLDQNLGHFEANLFHHAKIVAQAMLKLECIFDLEMPLEDGETRPNNM